MPKKILFWLDRQLIHFGIAKFLQEKLDADYYAIIDINHVTKKFFKEQQLVSFKKTWYFRDLISLNSSTPDMDYLTNFENKYDINLWQFLFTERLFNKFNEYYRFRYDELLQIIEQECKLFESILDEINPDFLLIKSTDWHYNHLLHEICKRRKISILTLSDTRFGSRFMLSRDVDIIDSSDISETFEHRSDLQLKEFISGYSSQASTWFKKDLEFSFGDRIKGILNFWLFVLNSDYKKFYAHYGRTRFRIIYKEVLRFLRKKFRASFIDDKLSRNFPQTKYVYYPLAFEPERATFIVAPFFTNQIELIKNIAQSLPIDYKLAVKEHPSQTIGGWRPVSFYRKILALPNVELIHPSVSSEELIKKCSLVITISGTPGLEAAFHGIPSITFGKTIYSSLPSVGHVTDLIKLPMLIKKYLNKTVKKYDLERFVNFVEKNSFEYNGMELLVKIFNKFYLGYLLVDVVITQEDMKNFLQENSNIFEKLALEHIKKFGELNNTN